MAVFLGKCCESSVGRDGSPSRPGSPYSGGFGETAMEPLEGRLLLSVPTLVLDANRATLDSIPMYMPNGDPSDQVQYPMLAMGNRVFFSADDGIHGRELWVTDGTNAGTRMVKDINPHGDGITFEPAMAAGAGRIFFSADDGVHGRSLWTSDGTSTGTIRLNPIKGGPIDPFESSDCTLVGKTMYVQGYGRILRTDGTPKGTYLLTPPTGTTTDQNYRVAGSVGDRIIIDAGATPWIASQSGGPAISVQSLSAGLAEDDLYYWLGRVGNGFLFAAGKQPADSSQPIQATLWTTDGTRKGTHSVGNINGLSLPGIYSLASGQETADKRVVFQVGTELWSSDGTSAGTSVIATVEDSQTEWFVAGNKTFFGQGTSGQALWTTDGTSAGTVKLNDNIGDRIYATGDLHGSLLITTTTTVDTIVGLETTTAIWRSDGTATGTVQVASQSSYARNSTFQPDPSLAIAGSAAYFAIGSQIYRTDGTSESTVPAAGATDRVSSVVTAGNLAVVGLSDPRHGAELWRIGTNSAAMIKDINRTSGGSNPSILGEIGGQVYFAADDGSLEDNNESPVWHVAAAGGEARKTGYGVPLEMSFTRYVIGDSLVLFNSDRYNVYGSEVADIIDGATGALRQVQGDNTKYAASAQLGNRVVLLDGDRNSYSVDNGDYSFNQATISVLNSQSGLISRVYQTDPADHLYAGTTMFTFHGAVYFTLGQPGETGSGSFDGNDTWSLWRTDGTSKGIQKLAIFTTEPKYCGIAGGRFYFVAGDQTYGTELWRSKGNAAGTRLAVDANPGAMDYWEDYPGSEAHPVSVAGRTFFLTPRVDGQPGRDLWYVSNAGLARRVSKQTTVPNWGWISDLTAIGDTLYVTTSTGVWTLDSHLAIKPFCRLANTGESELLQYNDSLYVFDSPQIGQGYGRGLLRVDLGHSTRLCKWIPGATPAGELLSSAGVLFFANQDSYYGNEVFMTRLR
ncbi:MAG: ELWxxDGT repeat protein [Tepidisphaeraceae bacterium]